MLTYPAKRKVFDLKFTALEINVFSEKLIGEKL